MKQSGKRWFGPDRSTRAKRAVGFRLGRLLVALAPDDTVRAVATVGLAHDKVDAVLSFERDGVRWTVDLGDEIGANLYTKGGYEAAEIDAVLAWLESRPRSRVLVDAGANVGTTSLPFAAAGYHVVAIEPVPKTFAMLQANVDDNKVSDRITCVPVALTDEPGEVEMWTARGSGQSEIVVEGAGSGAAQQMRQPATGKITVRSDRLGKVLADLDVNPAEVGLVWADVQGSEASVIRGAVELWAGGVPLFLEVDATMIHAHEGIEQFCALVTEHFAHFIPSDGLPDAVPLSIVGFRQYVDDLATGAFTNVLLLPRPTA